MPLVRTNETLSQEAMEVRSLFFVISATVAVSLEGL